MYLLYTWLLDITQFGWKVADKLAVDWDAPENVLNIHKRVDLLRGCCKKGCKTKHSLVGHTVDSKPSIALSTIKTTHTHTFIHIYCILSVLS